MSLSFKDIKDVIDYQNSTTSNKGYGFPLLPKFNGIVGNLMQEQVHVVSGLPSSGVSSFIDQNYVMSLLLQWYNTDPNERQKLKIFYYTMKDGELKKLQLLLCNYLKLVDNLRTDITTLNNRVGKLYDFSEDDDLKNGVEDATTFFDEVLDEEILVIKDKQYKPTDIFNDIEEYFSTIGSKTSKDEFVYEDTYEDQITLVIVDPVDYLLPDNEGYGIITGPALDEKFQRQIKSLKKMYKVSFVLAVPSSVGYVRTPKDTEPHFRHLGSYGSVADKGICLYNPINEKNSRFYDDEALYISENGNTLMRTWHVVRNTEGIESVHDRMFFLPGTSYLIEHTYKTGDKVMDIEDVLDVLLTKTCFHN
jgi:hypothetical protein